MAKILIGYSACPLTRAAFEAHGHDVWTCDLLPARIEAANDNGGQAKHLQGDVWGYLNRDWDMGVLHPMCTYMNVASSWALKDPDFKKHPDKGGYHQRLQPGTLFGAERRAAQAADIENFERLLALPYPVAIENPAPSSLNTAVRPPDQVVNPFQFGDDARKGTGFWLTKGLPLLVIDPAMYVEPRLVCENKHTFVYGLSRCPDCGSERYLPRWDNQTDAGQNRLSPGAKRWLDRSQTYPGIAAAMGDQWGRYMLEVDAVSRADNDNTPLDELKVTV